MAPKRRTTRLNPDATPTPVTDTHTTTSVTNAQIQAMINEGVTAALAARDATRNGDDSHTSGTGVRRPVQVARECTYPDFLKCQPLNFKGTEGVVGLTQWFEKMESVYSISNCTVACQVKFATCTLQGNALTWWNSHVKTTTPEAAHAMPWRTLKKMMTDKYCPRGEIKKLEFEMWNLKVKGNDVKKIDQVEKYVSGLPDTIMQCDGDQAKNYAGLPLSSATELMVPKRSTLGWSQVKTKASNGEGYHTDGLNLCVPLYFINYHQGGSLVLQNAASENQKGISRGLPKIKEINIQPGNSWKSPRLRQEVYCRGQAGATVTQTMSSHGQRETTWQDVGPIVQNDFMKSFMKDLRISTVRNEGTSEATTGTYGQRLHKTKFLALGSSGSICKEERWVFPDVHRLQGIEQTDSKEPLPTPKDR
ncbi:reverse transcriptase domain-containing protein [Tanacetum coccineum]